MSKEIWQERREELATLIGKGYGCQRIAKNFGTTHTTIHKVLGHLGLRTQRQQQMDSLLSDLKPREGH